MGGQAGSRGGCLKNGGLATSYELCLWNLCSAFLVKQISSFQEYVKKITKMQKKSYFC